jgi:hypothetical protein
MGQHVTISSGANLNMVLVEPIFMTHTVINWQNIISHIKCYMWLCHTHVRGRF